MYLQEEPEGVMAGLFGGGGLKKMAAYFRARAEGHVGRGVRGGVGRSSAAPAAKVAKQRGEGG